MLRLSGLIPQGKAIAQASDHNIRVTRLKRLSRSSSRGNTMDLGFEVLLQHLLGELFTR